MTYVFIMLRSIGVYIFVIIMMRIFGKKEIAQLSVIDFIFVLLISGAAQNAMIGDNKSVLGGFTSVATLFVINFLFKLLLYKVPSISDYIQGEPLILIYQGEINSKNLDLSKISLSDLEEAAREHGVANLSDVSLAILEVDGNISVISDNINTLAIKKHRSKREY